MYAHSLQKNIGNNNYSKKSKAQEKPEEMDRSEGRTNLMEKSLLSITTHELEADVREGVLLFDDVSGFILQSDDNGRISWRNLDNEVVNTGDVRFIITRDNTIFIGDVASELEKDLPFLPARPRFHHASLVKNEWPVFAGRASIVNGEVYMITNHTGHFAQPKKDIPEIFKSFEDNGVNVNKAKDLWYKGKFHNVNNPGAEPTQLNRPLKDNPNARMWGIYDEIPDISRSSISPEEYRKSVLK